MMMMMMMMMMMIIVTIHTLCFPFIASFTAEPENSCEQE